MSHGRFKPPGRAQVICSRPVSDGQLVRELRIVKWLCSWRRSLDAGWGLLGWNLFTLEDTTVTWQSTATYGSVKLVSQDYKRALSPRSYRGPFIINEYLNVNLTNQQFALWATKVNTTTAIHITYNCPKGKSKGRKYVYQGSVKPLCILKRCVFILCWMVGRVSDCNGKFTPPARGPELTGDLTWKCRHI